MPSTRKPRNNKPKNVVVDIDAKGETSKPPGGKVKAPKYNDKTYTILPLVWFGPLDPWKFHGAIIERSTMFPWELEILDDLNARRAAQNPPMLPCSRIPEGYLKLVKLNNIRAKSDPPLPALDALPVTTTAPVGFSQWAKCDHDGEPLFSIGDVVVGGASGGGRGLQCDVLVNVSGSTVGTNGEFPPRFASLSKHMKGPGEVIQFHWTDGGAPPVKAEFWRALIETVGTGHLVFACVGGHGRTGTSLAALLITHGWSVRESIAFLRDVYCEEAVETSTQILYLNSLPIGKERTAIPVDPKWTWTPEQEANAKIYGAKEGASHSKTTSVKPITTTAPPGGPGGVVTSLTHDYQGGKYADLPQDGDDDAYVDPRGGDYDSDWTRRNGGFGSY
jgi:hypothetical protein